MYEARGTVERSPEAAV